PPAIQHAHIQSAVHAGLLPACAAGFQRRPRIVEPHINALGKEVCRVHLVVFDKSDMAGETIVGGEGIDLVDEMLSLRLSRLCLSRKHYLQGTPLVEHHRLNAIQIMEYQRSTLVTGEPTGKSDR